MTSPASVVVELATSADTQAFGARLAGLLRPADLLILSGALGAGKTTLVQGIGAGLGVRGVVVSPTFVIARVHPGGRIPLVHVDAYRLSSFDEIDDLDLDVDVADSVTAVEWGTGLAERLGESHLALQLERDADTDVRRLTLHPSDDAWRARLAALL